MGRKRSTGDKPKKRKRVTVKLIPRVHAGAVTEPWTIMEEIQPKNHSHLESVRIALAWRLGWRADANGILCLGKCRKRGDLDRELDAFDFVILLNKEAWQGLNVKQKRALIDHELCHAQVVMDADGNPKMDDCDRPVCRIRKHDCEEFRSIVERHGLWTSDLAAIAQAAINDAKRPLLVSEESNGPTGNGRSGNGQAESTTADRSNPQAWRRLAIEKVIANEKLADKLIESDITTLGKLSDHMAEQGQWWPKSLRGIGPAAAENISDMLAKFWANHPEYCGSESASDETASEAIDDEMTDGESTDEMADEEAAAEEAA